MTEAQAREKVVNIMRSWIGLKRSDRSHAPIIDTYNSRTPRPRGYKVTYTDAYCATTWSAAAIKAGYTDIMPLECSVYYLIEGAKKLGCWVENDAHVPRPGDGICYDWEDGVNYATTDNTGAPDHVGMVESVNGKTITVIEGNMSGGIVGRRTIQVNGRYIRGYITPNYASKATEKAPAAPDAPAAAPAYPIGAIVEFAGSTHYTSSNAASGISCKPGKAKVTATYNGKHPYHLQAVSGGGSTVYGWVDEKDIKGVATSGTSTSSGTTTQTERKKLAPAKEGPTASISGTYKTTAAINLRYGPDRDKYDSVKALAAGTTVRCYGYHTGTWYYVAVGNVTGFLPSAYLKKA